MTCRAVIIGLLCSALFAAVCYFNDSVIKQNSLVRSYLPVSIFGLMIVVVLFINPFLARLRRAAALSGREIAVILALTLVAAHVPGGGLMHYFTTCLMMPHHIESTRPGWRELKVVESIPPQMLADADVNRDDALLGFLQGKQSGGKHIGFSEVPWYAWKRTLAFWLPLLVALYVALTGLSLVIHQQWAHNERLPYPIAAFATSLMPEDGEASSPCQRQRVFWLGLASVFAIHANNYVAAWWPDIFFKIPLSLDVTPLLSMSKVLSAGGLHGINQPRLYFSVIGIAFLLATDVSFSVALAPVFHVVAVGIFAVYGVSIAGGHMTATIEEFAYAGAYAGMALMLVYTGRHHYLASFLRALFLRTREAPASPCVWGARVFLVGMALFVFMMIRVGLDWPLAILYAGGVVMIFVVLSRILAETGVFYLHPWHFPCVTLFGLLGIEVLGAKGYLIMLMITTVVLLNPCASLMPFTLQAFKIVETKSVSPGRTAPVGVIALLVAFAIAVPLTLYWQYDMGAASVSDEWARDWAPQFGINAFAGLLQKYQATHGGPPADVASGLSRFLCIRPDLKLVATFAVMALLVLLFYAARLRFSWWPIHPVIFLVMGTWQSRILSFSFLVGWLLKTAAIRFGGLAAFQRLKPLIYGLIAGEILAALTPLLIGGLYYAVTGLPPREFSVM